MQQHWNDDVFTHNLSITSKMNEAPPPPFPQKGGMICFQQIIWS
jgi:hypothetical protein